MGRFIVQGLGALTIAVALVIAIGVRGEAASGAGGTRVAVYFYDRGGLSRVVVDDPHLRKGVFVFPRAAANLLAFTIAGRYVYWSAIEGNQGPLGANGRSTLYRAPLAGGHPQALARNLFYPLDLAVVRGRIYWIDQAAIGRANIDGSQVERRLAVPSQENGGGVGDGLASDGQYLYFSRCQTGSIGRVRLDGKGLNDRFVALPGRHCPQALGYSDGRLYFSHDLDSVGRIVLSTGRTELRWLRVSADSLAIAGGDILFENGGATGGVVGLATTRGQIINQQLFFIPQGEQIASARGS